MNYGQGARPPPRPSASKAEGRPMNFVPAVRGIRLAPVRPWLMELQPIVISRWVDGGGGWADINPQDVDLAKPLG